MNMYRRVNTVVLKANLTKILNNYCCFKVNITFDLLPEIYNFNRGEYFASREAQSSF